MLTFRTSVLLPSFRRPEKLIKCLSSLAEQTVRPDEVIVTWQGSDTETRDAGLQVQRQMPFQLRMVHSQITGIVPAENAALDTASGEIVLLIDDDAIAPHQWVARHLIHYRDPEVGAVGGPYDNHKEDGTYFPRRAFEPIGKVTWYGRMLGNMYDHLPEWQRRGLREVDYLVGNNMSLRRAAFDRFETGLAPYWQSFEIDVCMQVKANGYKILFDFSNKQQHYPNPDGNAYAPERSGDLGAKIYNAAYNQAFVLAKHSPRLLRPFRLTYLLFVGSVATPGLAALPAAVKRHGNPRREMAILMRTSASHIAGWIAGAKQRDRRKRLAKSLDRRHVLAFATLGAGSNEEARMRELLAAFSTQWLPFDRNAKLRMWWRLVCTLGGRAHDLVVMEGTGIAGGLALMVGRLMFGTRYVVSSGDAVGPFVGTQRALLAPLFGLYERLLYRGSIGFIGWTPYLVGRALSFGAPRAATAPGWAPFLRTDQDLAAARTRIRARYGIASEALVVGIVGSLVWSRRAGYCYGLELVRALRGLERHDLWVLIVGDGTGRRRLEAAAGDLAGSRIIFTGRVPQEEVPDYLAAMDVGSLPQSVDRVGSFRYTTKISEYLACGLPIITGQIPMAYDLDDGWAWRLPGASPWNDQYIDALRALLARLSLAELVEKRKQVAAGSRLFAREPQVKRITCFIKELLPS